MNEIPLSLLFFFLLLLIILSGFFSGSETALVSLNRYKLKHLMNSGHQGAKLSNELLSRPDRLLGLILIFNNFVNILAASIATIIGLRLFGEAGIAIATGLLTFVILVFSEVTPKTVAALHPEMVAFPAAYILKPLLWLCYPLVAGINIITNGLLKLFGVSPKHKTDKLSQEELKVIVNESGSLIPSRHRNMLVNILDLSSASVEDIMIPRNEIIGIDLDDDWNDILFQLNNSLHTRLPVFRNDINNIIGILHIRSAVGIVSSANAAKEDLKDIVKESYFIPEGTPLNRQLLSFQKNKQRIGLVVDEYGDIQGMITLDDILEEIVGEFTTDPANRLIDEIYKQDDGSYLVEGSVNIRELNRLMNWDLPTAGAKTVNGLILEFLESIPQTGTSVLLNKYPIEIVQVADNTVKTVKICPRIS